MREYKTVKIYGEEIPIRCNIRVLGEIQDIYGPIKEFEKAITGGEEEEDENGKKYWACRNERSMKAVAKVLPLMVNEGLHLTGGKPLKDDEIIEGLETNVYTVAKLMYQEYADCFKQKK